jgi:hypothetical protein
MSKFDPSAIPDDWKLERKDPPQLRQRRGNLAKSEMIDYHVEMLREEPGRWFCVRHSVKNGSVASKPFRVRGCETLVYAAEPPDEGFDVYARWPVVEVRHF